VLSNSLRGGVSWIAASAIVVAVVNYGYSLGLAYAIPAHSYAMFAAGQAVLLIVGTIAGAAGPWLLAFEIARAPRDRSARRTAVLFANVLNGVLGTLAAVVVGLVARSFASTSVAVVMAIASLAIFQAATAVGYLQGDGRFRAIALFRGAEVLLKVACGGCAVAAGFGAAGALFGFVASDGVMAAIGFWLFRSDFGGQLSALRTAVGSRPLWRRTAGIAGVQALTAVIINLDTILVAVLHREQGYAATYQVSVVLSRVPVFVSVAISLVAFRAISSGRHSTVSLVKKTVGLFACLGVPAAIVVAVLPGSILRLMLPESYDAVRMVLPFTAICGLLFGLVNLLTTYFQAELRFQRMLWILSAGVLGQTGLICLGDRIDGPKGLALGALAGSLTLVVVLAYEVRRAWFAIEHRNRHRHARASRRPSADAFATVPEA
jgi:O-antigen/teichoic acid export membrane protein